MQHVTHAQRSALDALVNHQVKVSYVTGHTINHSSGELKAIDKTVSPTVILVHDKYTGDVYIPLTQVTRITK